MFQERKKIYDSLKKKKLSKDQIEEKVEEVALEEVESSEDGQGSEVKIEAKDNNNNIVIAMGGVVAVIAVGALIVFKVKKK